jgi:hypothetical protein
MAVQSHLKQIEHENPILKKKKSQKKGLVEWLKMKALSSNSSIAKNKKI